MGVSCASKHKAPLLGLGDLDRWTPDDDIPF